MVAAGELWYALDRGSLNFAQAITQRYLHPALWDPFSRARSPGPPGRCSARRAWRWSWLCLAVGAVMNIRKKRAWELPEKAATPERVYLDRRRILAGLGLGGVILAAPAALRMAPERMRSVQAEPEPSPDLWADLYPVQRNGAYRLTVRSPRRAGRPATTTSTSSARTSRSRARRRRSGSSPGA